jgi:hypothetical protein
VKQKKETSREAGYLLHIQTWSGKLISVVTITERKQYLYAGVDFITEWSPKIPT